MVLADLPNTHGQHINIYPTTRCNTDLDGIPNRKKKTKDLQPNLKIASALENDPLAEAWRLTTTTNSDRMERTFTTIEVHESYLRFSIRVPRAFTHISTGEKNKNSLDAAPRRFTTCNGKCSSLRDCCTWTVSQNYRA
jgi:hypothetical protein